MSRMNDVEAESDGAFTRALVALDRSEDWKRFAIAGRTVAEVLGQQGLNVVEPRLAAGPAEDRRAWLWGFNWAPGAAPPEERPEGACAECWRLGEPCREHGR